MRPIRPLVGALALLLAAGAAYATTFQMVADPTLTDHAAVVADVRVASVGAAPQGQPATDYQVEVQRLLKGSLSGSTIVVRVPGGVGADGLGLRIWGAPQLAVDEQALLFLRPRQDGTYAVLDLMLGAFHRVGQLAVRDLDDTRELTPQGLKAGSETVARDYDAFAAWIADRAAGIARPADYVRSGATSGLRAAIERFTMLRAKDGVGMRWFLFDRGGHVDWQVEQGGQPGLSEADTIAAFQVALQAWDGNPGTRIDYRYVGTTAATAGHQSSDGVNAIIFGDPNHEVQDTFDCGTGGVIAQGGPWFYTSTTSWHGSPYHETAEADIVVNDGTQCLFQNDLTVAQEVFAHELGHTLGLGHSCGDASSPPCGGTTNRALNDALMRANVHNDGRGARLAPDDQAGIAVLYGNGSPVGGRVPTSPARLVAHAQSSTSVLLTWRDRSNNETGFSIEIKVGKRPFAVVASVTANTTSASIPDLNPGTFYLFRVRAVNAKGYSGYSNVTRVTTPH